MQFLAAALTLALALVVTQRAHADPFVRTKGDHFVLDGAPFRATGVNNHYLPWGSAAEVTRVLDDADAMGANVVRTFLGPVIGALDDSVPTIWKFHNDQADSSNLNVHGTYLLYWDAQTRRMGINTGPDGMQKIDFLIAEAGKRHLRLIISFLDFWAFTGGAQQMRAWYGSQDKDSFFFTDPRTVADYRTWVKFVLERRNTITGTLYRDDPVIMAWDLMNEPQAPLRLRKSWLATMSGFVKSLDPNHLVATGEDRLNPADFHIPTIDFVTWHGYPLYFGVRPGIFDGFIRRSCQLARTHSKPVILEEFGLARSNRNPDQAQAYKAWLDSLRFDQDCAGWLVWRLVAQQDSGAYPADTHDEFDVHQDGGATWQMLADATKNNDTPAGPQPMSKGSSDRIEHPSQGRPPAP